MRAVKHPKTTILLVVLLCGLAYSYSWTYTPRGRLDYPVAVSLRLLSFPYRLKPNPDHDLTVTVPANLAFMVDLVLPAVEVGDTRDMDIPSQEADVPVRVYWPQGFEEIRLLPVIIFIHGGGFMLADIDVYDRFTRTLANDNNSIVISVGYRLTPAHPFPAGLNDSYAVVEWAAKNAAGLGGDPARLVVAGDSAGGNLATVISQKARNENGPAIAAQVLYYPVVDLSDKEYQSYRFRDEYGLSRELSDTFTDAYVGHLDDRTTPYVSPLYADTVQDLPPALVITAGFDPLTDATLLYVERLKAAGVDVTAVHYPSTIHGFMNAPVFTQRKQAFNETQRFLSRTLNVTKGVH